MKRPRLVITGMGAVTPLGLGTELYWRNLVSGKCGIDYISRFDVEELPVKIAAEIREPGLDRLLPHSVLKASSPFMEYAFIAAEEAFTQAGLASVNPEEIGVCLGTALGGTPEMARYIEDNSQKRGKVSPHLVPRTMGNIGATHFAIAHKLHGPALTISTACSAGGDALMNAAMLLLMGEASAMIVMGGESILDPTIISSLFYARALSRRNDDPKGASRPFDRDRDGFVIGEGGGAIVLETEEHARARNATIHAVLTGWGNAMDAYHITAPDPCGVGAAKCMKKALKAAGLNPSQIDYINAHGTSTQLGDQVETMAIKEVFGSACPPLSSTKGATGHLMGAGGLTEVIACVMAIRDGLMPPTLNLRNPDPLCDLDYVPNEARKGQITHAMSNSLGFGGQNSSIIVSKYA